MSSSKVASSVVSPNSRNSARTCLGIMTSALLSMAACSLDTPELADARITGHIDASGSASIDAANVHIDARLIDSALAVDASAHPIDAAPHTPDAAVSIDATIATPDAAVADASPDATPDASPDASPDAAQPPSVDWSNVTPDLSPPERIISAMVYDSHHQQTIMFSGNSAQTGHDYDDTWAWDGSAWTQLSPDTSPPARHGHSMAYDAATQTTILFGGIQSSLLDDTWQWNGTDWSQLSPTDSPPSRRFPTMAYDDDTQQVILFGGTNENDTSGPAINDMWAFDGTNWTELTPNTLPPVRFFSNLTYDAGHHYLLLYGGTDNVAPFLFDTWTYDGTNWTQQEPIHQPDVVQGVMQYDATRGTVVLFGTKNTNSVEDGETWEWDGTDWTLDTSIVSPPTRQYDVSAYDEVNGQFVLFGGFVNESGAGLADTWTL